MYTALYRAERPEVFDEILGQEHIVKILKHQIATNTVGHAYLFCGTRGTGKTTTARILAKGVNCLAPDVEGRPCGECANCKAISQGNFMDVVEIDAASNNGVDNIRELRESVKYPPAVGRKKVYIIDEVHMLSAGAFNALLKTLEEPPEDVMFILATTEPQKLPQTILSRCLKFDFKRVPLNLILGGMKRICDEKGVHIEDSALRLVANCADGSVRDGLSILDQVLASGSKEISREEVLEYIGTAGEDFFIELTEAASVHDVSSGLRLLDEALADGKDVRTLMKDWMTFYRNLMIAKFVKDPEEMLNMSAENIQKIKAQSDHISMDEINDAILVLSKAIGEARWSTQPRVLLELALVNIAASQTAGRAQPGARAGVAVRAAGQATASAGFGAGAGGAEAPRTKVAQAAPQEPRASAPSSGGEPRPAQEPAQNTGNPSAKAAQAAQDTRPQTQARKPLIAPASPDDSRANDMLWQQVFEAGENEVGSFNILRSSTELIHLGEKSFTLLAKTEFARKFAERQRDLIEKIMKDKIGHHLQMVCCLESELKKERMMAEPTTQDTVDEDAKLAQQASEILGMDIEID